MGQRVTTSATDWKGLNTTHAQVILIEYVIFVKLLELDWQANSIIKHAKSINKNSLFLCQNTPKHYSMNISMDRKLNRVIIVNNKKHTS